MLRKLAIAFGLVLLLGFAVHAVLGLDWLTPRSKLAGYFAVGMMDRLDLSHLDDWNRAAKEKYGAAVETPVRMTKGTAYWEARIKDEVVESHPLSGRLPHNVYGVFMVIDLNGARVRFPFLIARGDHGQGAETPSRLIKRQLGKSEPADLLSFEDEDWRQNSCRRVDAPIVGYAQINSTLELGHNDLCSVEAVGTRRSALVGVATVGGGLSGLFGPRICRSLASSWLAAKPDAGDTKTPDYVACILQTEAHGSERSDLIAAHFFEVRNDGSLVFFRG